MYRMSVVKLMTGTGNFLAFPDETKKCQAEPQEDCIARRYIEETQEQCGCVPWALGVAVQVTDYPYHQITGVIRQRTFVV